MGISSGKVISKGWRPMADDAEWHITKPCSFESGIVPF